MSRQKRTLWPNIHPIIFFLLKNSHFCTDSAAAAMEQPFSKENKMGQKWENGSD